MITEEYLTALFKSLYIYAAGSPDPSSQNAARTIDADGEVGPVFLNTFPYYLRAGDRHLQRPEKYMFIEHAERNAIYDAARQGHSCYGGTMVALWAACADCARAIVQSGITTVYSHSFYTNAGHTSWDETIRAAEEIFAAAGVNHVLVDTPLFPNGERTILFNGKEVFF